MNGKGLKTAISRGPFTAFSVLEKINKIVSTCSGQQQEDDRQDIQGLPTGDSHLLAVMWKRREAAGGRELSWDRGRGELLQLELDLVILCMLRTPLTCSMMMMRMPLLLLEVRTPDGNKTCKTKRRLGDCVWSFSKIDCMLRGLKCWWFVWKSSSCSNDEDPYQAFARLADEQKIGCVVGGRHQKREDRAWALLQ